MEENKRASLKSFIYGAVAGAAVGAVAGLLFAPKSGKELRKDIADTAQRVGEKTADLGRSAGTTAQSLVRRSSGWAVGIRSKLSRRGGEVQSIVRKASADQQAEEHSDEQDSGSNTSLQ